MKITLASGTVTKSPKCRIRRITSAEEQAMFASLDHLARRLSAAYPASWTLKAEN
jgi:hypothetical protein